MVVVTMVVLVGRVVLIVVRTLVVARIGCILIFLGVGMVVGLAMKSICVFRLCSVVVTVVFRVFDEWPVTQCIGLTGLRAGFEAMTMRWLRRGLGGGAIRIALVVGAWGGMIIVLGGRCSGVLASRVGFRVAWTVFRTVLGLVTWFLLHLL